jgi:hypothetical protein
MAHERLYYHYAAQPPDLPDTLEQMQPLFNAITHGVKAGRKRTMNCYGAGFSDAVMVMLCTLSGRSVHTFHCCPSSSIDSGLHPTPSRKVATAHRRRQRSVQGDWN